MKKAIIFIYLFVFISSTAFSQVVINEFSASNLHSFFDNYTKTEDWIELYNTADTEINLGGFHLSDKESKPGKWEIPAGTVIPAHGFLVFWCSGRDEVSDGNYHTNFKLAQTKSNEIVLFSDANENVIEQFNMDLTLVEHSRCRSEDGGDNWVVCTEPTLGTSNNGSTQYTGYTQTPSADKNAGFYTDSVTVTLTNNEPNSTLRYTINGNEPVETSPIYTAPIKITQTTVIKAKAFSDDDAILPGKMDFNTYFINEDFTVPVFSVASNEVINLANGDGDLIPIGSLEYFNIDKEREATSYGSLNRHGQDSWILPHRSIDWVSRDEMGYSKAVKSKLFSYSNRKNYQKFMFRNSGDDNYPANGDSNHYGSTHIRDEYVQTLAMEGGLKLDQRAQERVVLFLNGQYWGLYGLRERPVDHDYTKEYYDQGKYDLQYLTTWAATEAQYGGSQAFQDWTTLRDFILNNDMANPLNYEMVKDQLNVISLMDYMIVNLNCVASDWLNYNTGWWRGMNPDGDHKKWGYILWDLDATFDYYINYSGVPNISADAKPCDIDEIGDYMDVFFETDSNGNSLDVGQHEKIFKKLQEENKEFKQLYYSRQADLQNTVYSCENMISTLERMLAVIEPEMPRQIERWGGSMSEWNQNVQRLKDFINARCELFDEGMVDCFELDGPFDIVLKVEPEGLGTIKINTIDIEEFPWSGTYYGGMENLIKAKSTNDEYFFSHWESSAGSVILPDLMERKASIKLTAPDTLTAVFTNIVAVNDPAANIPITLYPNPAKDQINLKYELKESMDIDIALYAITGQQIPIQTQGKSNQSAGIHTQIISLDRSLIPAGIYLLKMKADGYEITRKVTIL